MISRNILLVRVNFSYFHAVHSLKLISRKIRSGRKLHFRQTNDYHFNFQATNSANSGSTGPGSTPGSSQVSPMMSSWSSNTGSSPWDQSAQQQSGGWGSQQYSMAPPPGASQYNQFTAFGAANSYAEGFRNQRSGLPSPSVNHQFLGLNGNPATGKYSDPSPFLKCQKLPNLNLESFVKD